VLEQIIVLKLCKIQRQCRKHQSIVCDDADPFGGGAVHRSGARNVDNILRTLLPDVSQL
jgi:hypothetical protein